MRTIGHLLPVTPLAAGIMCILAVAIATAATYTVLPGGGGNFETIQQAVDAVIGGDVIELGDGTFTGPGNRDIDYLGKAITVRSASGNCEACVIACGGSPDAPHRGFVFTSGEDRGSILEDVTIAGGFAEDGGGIYCDGTSPTIRRVELTGNGADERGGGMFCNGASPVLEDVTFSYNYAPGPIPYHEGRGGGMYCSGGWPVLTDVLFVGNWTTSTTPYPFGFGQAGGMKCGEATLTRVVFENNGAGGGPGGLACGSATLTDCRFTGNSTAVGDGGGMSCYGSPTLINVVFEGNVTQGSPAESRPFNGYGGALLCGSGSPTLVHITFSNNRAFFGGGAVSCQGDVEMTHCTFEGNSSAIDGGAVYVRWGSATIANCTFAGNCAESGAGGGLHCVEGGVASVSNSIIAFSECGQAVWLDISSAVTLTCCDIFGNDGGDWVGGIAGQLGVNGNISEDPLFCLDAHDEWPYTLHSDSPCAPSNPECGLIGAWSIGCSPTAVELMTWGAIKAMYR